MPTYSITDTKLGETIIVDAGNPAQAVRNVIADRFIVNGALDASEAMDLLEGGATRLKVLSPPTTPVAALQEGEQPAGAVVEPITALTAHDVDSVIVFGTGLTNGAD